MDDSNGTVVTAAQARALAERVLDPDRTRPLVGVSTHWATGRPCIDVTTLRAQLGEFADVVVVETGDATWALADALPDRLDVYNGALRLWRPDVQRGVDPRRSPLLLIRTSNQGHAAVVRLLRELGVVEEGTSASGQHPQAGDVVTATVTAVTDREAAVDVAGTPGQVAKSGVIEGRVTDVRDVLRVGQTLRARVLRLSRDGPVVTLKEGQRTPWRQFVTEYGEGDVLRGRVCSPRHDGVLVEVAPGVRGLVASSELGDADPAPGHVVAVKIMSFDRAGTGLALSMAAVRDTERPRPGLAVLPGGPVFLGGGDHEETRELRAALDDANARLTAREEDQEQLRAELDAVHLDRKRVFDELRAVRSQAHELRKTVRGERERRRQLEARLGLAVEVSDAEEFLDAVRAAYERMYVDADRERYPLARMQVGAALLARLDELDGAPTDKVVEVCAHVAAGRHWEIPGLEAHQLREAARGPARVRSADGAQAWRCALQLNRPSARRLHWWEVPGAPRTVEFASVGVHDDVDIPE